MNPAGLATLLAAAPSVDDAGFAAAVAYDSGVAPHQVAAVLDGEASTATLPAPVAARVVARVVARDPEQALTAAAGDLRVEVLTALGELASPDATAEAALRSTLDRRGDQHPTDALVELVTNSTGAVRRALLDLLKGAGPDLRAAAAMAALTPRDAASAVTPTTVTPPFEFLDSLDRHDVVAALALIDEILAALPAPVAGRRRERSAKQAARRNALVHLAVDDPDDIEGPTSPAALCGLTPLAECTDTEAFGRLVATLSVPGGARGATVDAMVAALTCDGTRPVPLPATTLSRITALPAVVAFAVVRATGPGVSPVEAPEERARYRWFCTRAAAGAWSEAELTGLLAAHPVAFRPVLFELAAMHLDGALTWPSPAHLVDASMRVGGLAPWLAAEPAVVDQLAAAAAGISSSRWEVLLALAPKFHGTPAELVAVTDTLAP